MKCPLLTVGSSDTEALLDSELGKCLQDECAWWSDAYQSCAICRLATGIDDLFNQLEQINAILRLVK